MFRNLHVDVSSKVHVKMSICKVSLIAQHISLIPKLREFVFGSVFLIFFFFLPWSVFMMNVDRQP